MKTPSSSRSIMTVTRQPHSKNTRPTPTIKTANLTPRSSSRGARTSPSSACKSYYSATMKNSSVSSSLITTKSLRGGSRPLKTLKTVSSRTSSTAFPTRVITSQTTQVNSRNRSRPACEDKGSQKTGSWTKLMASFLKPNRHQRRWRSSLTRHLVGVITSTETP